MQTSVRDYSYDQKETIKGFFTNDEWDAIDSALSDFQDYGERESELNDSVGRKITSTTIGAYTNINPICWKFI